MILNNHEWFLLGALSILFLFFITYYLTLRSEIYNFFYALGCFITIIRTISYSMVDTISSDLVWYGINVKIDHLTFIWGPFAYILLTNSLFPKLVKKVILNTVLIVSITISVFIIFVPMDLVAYDFLYDYIILSFLICATYICTSALLKKLKFSMPVFIANFILVLGILHDVLRGSHLINTPFGEIYGYMYLIYVCIVAVVLAKKYRENQISRMKSELNFLHAQIKPHFLYNTLNTIIAYSKKDPEQARELLVELSTYLRGKFKSEKEILTSLKDEIDLIKSYLNIEKVRFKERLDVEYDIDEDCNILIPCLILQPIVENAVRHGLVPKKDGGKISISVKNIDDVVVVKIKDNGVGIEADELKDVLEGKKSGIGISNTNERLKKYYNTKIVAKSEVGVYSEFTIIIPRRKGA